MPLSADSNLMQSGSMRSASLPMTALLLALLCACGNQAEVEPVGLGDLEVGIHLLGESDVDYVRVTLTPTPTSSGIFNEADLQRVNGGFSQTLPSVASGEYTAVAHAYQQGNPQPIFLSEETAPFTVPGGSSVTVDLFLYQDKEGPDDEAPYFVWITHDRVPVQERTVTYTVKADGGEGALTLRGIADPGNGTFGPVSGDPRQGTATITWNVPATTDAEITLEIEDEEGSTVRMHYAHEDIPASSGSLSLDIDLNHAPYAIVDVQADNQPNSTTVEVVATLIDPDGDDVTFSFSGAVCESSGYEVSPTPDHNGQVASGQQASVTLTANDGDPRSCDLTLILIDTRLPAVAQSTQVISIQTGWNVAP